MIKEAKKLEDGTVQSKYELNIECYHCAMPVDAEEYNSGVCSDCKKPWKERKHVGVYVTSIPMMGKSK
jgi:hypothetical protein